MPQSVPHPARVSFARITTRALQDVVDAALHTTGPAADELLDSRLHALADIPRRILADGGSSRGRAHRIARRAADVDAGVPLADEADDDAERAATGAPARAERRPLSEDQRCAARIQRHLQAYSITRAAGALNSEPLANARSPVVIAALREKHPSAELPQELESDVPALRIDAETLKRALERLSAKRGAAGGPSAWTYEHVLSVTKTASDAFDAVLAFVNLILSGKLPRHASLLDSSLIGLQKQDDGVRPIAVGEVWYRLAGLCALTACEAAGKALAPLQMAVGVSGGVDAVVHAIRAALAEDPQAALLTVDQANAFNSVARPAVFEAVKERVPELLPMVQWAYGAPTDLHIVGAPAGTPPVQSQTGVRQGDPLGMLLFSLALQRPLERTRDAAPDVAVLALADDVSLVGRVDALGTAFRTLQGADGAAGIGLRVQQRKCAITSGPPDDAARLAVELGIEHRPGGVTVCGTPIGTAAYVAEALSRRATDVVAQVQRLSSLPLPKQSQLVLLKSSLSLRMAHLQRTTPWAQVEESTRAVEGEIVETFAGILRLPTQADPAGWGRASGREREQLALPLRHGGFGLRKATAIEADAALLSGAAKAQAAMAEGPAACRPFEGASRAPLVEKWHGVFDDVGPGREWDPGDRDLSEDVVRDTLPRLQNIVSREIGDRDGKAFLEACDLSTDAGRHDAARLRSAGCGPASAWITALPGPHTTLLDAEVVMAGRHRLGVGVPSRLPVPPCFCDAESAGEADHAMVCRKTAGWRTRRHDNMIPVICRALHCTGNSTSLEPLYAGVISAQDAQGAAAGQRRGDILTTAPSGRILAIDCVVTHPAAASYVKQAALKCGDAAERAEQRKRLQFKELDSGAFEFRPFAIESYGRLGKEATRLISELGDAVEESGRGSKAMFVRNVRQQLSCALCRGNARMYHHALGLVTQRVGRGYQQGCDVLCEDVVDS